MSYIMERLRAIANGTLDESAGDLSASGADDGYDLENDEAFLTECMGACMPTFLMMGLMDESAETLDEAVASAFLTAQDYLVAQGMIDEAATVNINNPKVNVVRLNKESQIKRLTTIIVLKMARKENMKAYKKYKLGQKIKKTNMEEMKKRNGAKAERIARKLWAQSKKSGKVSAVVESKKSELRK